MACLLHNSNFLLPLCWILCFLIVHFRVVQYHKEEEPQQKTQARKCRLGLCNIPTRFPTFLEQAPCDTTISNCVKYTTDKGFRAHSYR